MTRSCLLLVLSAVTSLAWSAEPGLVASYDFVEGSGSVARDGSGNGNDGQIRDATWVRTNGGHCLSFNGETSVVDCGAGASLDLRRTISVEAWVFPAGRPTGEPGILGKQFDSFLLTYYRDGQCYWYIGSGGNNAHAPLAVGVWQHIVGTFDGKTLCLYINGKLAASSVSKFAEIPHGGSFLIGTVAGNAAATDPAYTRTAHFMGLVANVRVYDRALPAETIAAHAQADLPRFEISEPFRPVRAAATIGDGGVRVRIGDRGELQVDGNGESYLLDSAYSYPGEKVGWNALSRSEGSEASWAPAVAKASAQQVAVTARGSGYDLRRVVSVREGLITLEDTLTSRAREPLGVMARHNVTAHSRLVMTAAPGGAEAPIIFLQGERASLGVVLEDDLSRLRQEPITALRVNQFTVRLGNMALAPGKSVTFRWTLQPLPKGTDYWAFINGLRQRWGSNFAVQGPFDWISMTSPLLDNPAELKAYLQRKRVRIMALSPWLDYDPGTEDRVWSRNEYKRHAQKAIRALKAADPDIRCVGCIETDWVALDPAKIPGGDKLPVAGKGSEGLLTVEQSRIIDAANLPWRDSLKRDAQGRLTLELYMRGGKPQTSLWVYPALGNYQYRFLLGQMKFLFDEVGTDGFYIDEFSQAWSDSNRTYDGWDGVSADVDPITGKLIRTYADCGYAGIGARVSLVKYALSRGKIVVANTYSSSREEQSLPVNRFSETWDTFDPMTTEDGQEPAALPYLFRSNLASPIGLGILGHPEKHDTARRLMKAVVTYLRHGMVYYHYFLEDIPQSGDGSGEYGPVNHMFPITPVELGEGFIIGKERTLTCVSGSYRWPGVKAPRMLVFDLNGREVPSQADVRRNGDAWTVQLKLRDWGEIAVIEAASP